MIRYCFITLFAILAISACSDDSDDNYEDENCMSTEPAWQDTVVIGSTSYFIIASYGPAPQMLIELVGYTNQPGDSLAVDLLQVSGGQHCYSTANSVQLHGSTSEAFLFDSVPSWANNSAVKASIVFRKAGMEYFLQDTHVNQ